MTFTLTPSQQRIAAEQEERNERIDVYIEALRQRFVDVQNGPNSNGSCKSVCSAPDLLLQISILLEELEAQGLMRRRADIQHLSHWISNIAFGLKPRLAIAALEQEAGE